MIEKSPECLGWYEEDLKAYMKSQEKKFTPQQFHLKNYDIDPKYIDELIGECTSSNVISSDLYKKMDIVPGLRGTFVGLTNIGDVKGHDVVGGTKIPVEGRLNYRGIDIKSIVQGFQNDNRQGFCEITYLLLFGKLPSSKDLEKFAAMIDNFRDLPEDFIESIIINTPSFDLMNMLSREVLALHPYDIDPENIGIKNVLRQGIELIARFPAMIAYGYIAKRNFYNKENIYLNKPPAGLSTAENFLYMIRPNSEYTSLEAELLDLALVLFAEHGGGNNSTFTLQVLTSSDTDTYSAVSAAIGSLKGPKHGGATSTAAAMMDEIKHNVKDWKDEEEIIEYLKKIINKEAFDGSGLIYGIGNAVYTLSDPRAIILCKKAKELASKKNRLDEFELFNCVAKIAPRLLSKNNRFFSANADFYSGLVYSMLDIPPELYTPIFAMARISGWIAHRIEELSNGNKLIRPDYKKVYTPDIYIALTNR